MIEKTPAIVVVCGLILSAFAFYGGLLLSDYNWKVAFAFVVSGYGVGYFVRTLFPPDVPPQDEGSDSA